MGSGSVVGEEVVGRLLVLARSVSIVIWTGHGAGLGPAGGCRGERRGGGGKWVRSFFS